MPARHVPDGSVASPEDSNSLNGAPVNPQSIDWLVASREYGNLIPI